MGLFFDILATPFGKFLAKIAKRKKSRLYDGGSDF
jgi:hypothetical protein